MLFCVLAFVLLNPRKKKKKRLNEVQHERQLSQQIVLCEWKLFKSVTLSKITQK